MRLITNSDDRALIALLRSHESESVAEGERRLRGLTPHDLSKLVRFAVQKQTRVLPLSARYTIGTVILLSYLIAGFRPALLPAALVLSLITGFVLLVVRSLFQMGPREASDYLNRIALHIETISDVNSLPSLLGLIQDVELQLPVELRHTIQSTVRRCIEALTETDYTRLGAPCQRRILGLLHRPYANTDLSVSAISALSRLANPGEYGLRWTLNELVRVAAVTPNMERVRAASELALETLARRQEHQVSVRSLLRSSGNPRGDHAENLLRAADQAGDSTQNELVRAASSPTETR